MTKHRVLPDALLSAISEFMGAQLGLYFPRERWDDLERGISAAARDFDLPDPQACVRWLLSGPLTRNHIEVLASHLTVGETYFFREQQSLEVLEREILPELLRARSDGERRLRVWSAGCSTGEEAYSIAMLLDRLIPDPEAWNVTILASDINARSLSKAAAGVYGEWSFRGAPEWIKPRYFKPLENGRFELQPHIRSRVTFSHLNLADDIYPSLLNNTNAMDVILCRNVLMYFASHQARKVIQNLHHVLVEGGWLVVSPSEASHVLFSQFDLVNFPGVILYQKNDTKLRTKRTPVLLGEQAEIVQPTIKIPLPSPPPAQAAVPKEMPSAPASEEPAPETPRTLYAAAESLYQQGRYAEAADTILAVLTRHAPESAAFSLLARTRANQGNLPDALSWCDRWIAADKLEPAARYLRAVVLLEQGDAEQARASLQQAVYLQPDFVLAHFALGNLARGRSKMDEADKHFANALRLLRSHQANDLLPESDGLTAGRLTEIITSMTTMENAP